MVGLIIWITIFLVVAIIAFKITKSIMKAVFIISSILTLILIIFIFLLISDTITFRDNIQTTPNLYLLEDNHEIIAGFSTVFEEDAKFNLLEEEQILNYENNRDNLKKLVGDNYKIFVIQKQAFNSIDRVQGGDIDLTMGEVEAIFDSETPLEKFLSENMDIPSHQISFAKKDLLEELDLNDETQFKGLLFAMLFGTTINKEGHFLIFIFDRSREGTVSTYPETTLFKVMKKIPISLLKNSIINMNEGE